MAVRGGRLMKKWITIILAVCLSVVLTACSLGKVETQTASEETVKDPNVLIVYYSDSDIMGHVAEAIASKTGGRIVEIRRQVPFPVDLKQAMQAAREEAVNHTLPPIATKIPNANSYKTRIPVLSDLVGYYADAGIYLPAGNQSYRCEPDSGGRLTERGYGTESVRSGDTCSGGAD